MGTKGLALKVAIIAVAIIVNSAVVVYFARDSFDLPNWLNQLSLTLNDDIAIKPPTNEVGNEFDQASQTMPPPEVPKRVFEHAHSYATRCIDKKKPPDTKRLYTWLDKNGIRHISDKPRVLDGSTVVEIAGTIEPETISLNFLTHNLSYDVQSALQNRVTHAMRFQRVPDADHHGLVSGRGKGLPGAVPPPSRQILCAAAGASAVQTADHGVRLRQVFPDRAVFPR